MWTQPIYDRARTDIDNKTAKAYYNVTDLNRIEQDCTYLAAIFNTAIQTREWCRTDFPTADDFSRILENINRLRAAYYTYQTTPQTPDNPVNEYHKANDLEKILNDLKSLYDDNARNVIYAGEVYSGQTIGVI